MKAKTLSYLVGAVLWVACAYQFALLLVRGMQGRIADVAIFGSFLTHGSASERAAPIAVLAVLGWVMLEVVVHFWRTQREYLAVRLLKAAAEEKRPQALRTALSHVAPPNTRAARRARLISEHLSSPAHLREVIPSAASLDDAEFGSHYNVTKTYVWILPVIGFMGTAWGMLNAIGGFSAALSDTRDIGVLADRLGQLVIPGLAHAFSITILALGSAIVAHFWVTILQSREGDALDDLNQACLGILTDLPDASSSAVGLAGLVEQLLSSVKSIEETVKLEEVRNSLNAAAAAVLQAANSLRAAGAELTNSITIPYKITITRGDRS